MNELILYLLSGMFYYVEIIFFDAIIIMNKLRKFISLSPDKENNKRLNFTPQAFESVIFKRFCFRRIIYGKRKNNNSQKL